MSSSIGQIVRVTGLAAGDVPAIVLATGKGTVDVCAFTKAGAQLLDGIAVYPSRAEYAAHVQVDEDGVSTPHPDRSAIAAYPVVEPAPAPAIAPEA